MPWAWACCSSQASASLASGHCKAWVWQRLRMVGSRLCAAPVASTKRKSPCGSSSVLSKVLADSTFRRSAGYTSTTLVLPRERVICAKPTTWRAASTRIHLLGLRFFSSRSFWVDSSSGQSSSKLRVSGISAHRSGWVRTSTPWQLSQRPQAPCGVGWSHSQARASARPSSYCPKPDGPVSSKAWPRWCSSDSSCRCNQGASVWSALMRRLGRSSRAGRTRPAPGPTPRAGVRWR